jgi:CBS domain containing-hemolysin-like protein
MMSVLPIIFSALAASFIFSGMEIAFFSADRLRLELDKGNHRIAGRIIELFYRHPGQYISSLFVGCIFSQVLFCLAFQEGMQTLITNSFVSSYPGLLVQVIILSLLILPATDIFPNIIFRINPSSVLFRLSIPAAFFYFLFYPFARLLEALSNFTLRRIIGIKIERNYNHAEIRDGYGEYEKSSSAIFQNTGTEIKLFQNALDFSKLKIRNCMVPRTDIVMLDVNEEIEVLNQRFIETGYSKILICQDNYDNIIGYVHSSDLFHHPADIRSCLRKISFVPETMEAKKLLSTLLREHKSTAIVVDEFGGTAGMITTEDILEEIFGEIEDEHDIPDIMEKKISDHHYIFSGRAEISFLNEKYHFNIDEDDHYETLAGYLLFHHSSFPKNNTRLIISDYEFRILRSTKTKIELIEMKKISNF